jgi:hypothetical protein
MSTDDLGSIADDDSLQPDDLADVATTDGALGADTGDLDDGGAALAASGGDLTHGTELEPGIESLFGAGGPLELPPDPVGDEELEQWLDAPGPSDPPEEADTSLDTIIERLKGR